MQSHVLHWCRGPELGKGVREVSLKRLEGPHYLTPGAIVESEIIVHSLEWPLGGHPEDEGKEQGGDTGQRRSGAQIQHGPYTKEGHEEGTCPATHHLPDRCAKLEDKYKKVELAKEDRIAKYVGCRCSYDIPIVLE